MRLADHDDHPGRLARRLLLIGIGGDAALRRPLGITIVGG